MQRTFYSNQILEWKKIQSCTKLTCQSDDDVVNMSIILPFWIFKKNHPTTAIFTMQLIPRGKNCSIWWTIWWGAAGNLKLVIVLTQLLLKNQKRFSLFVQESTIIHKREEE